MNSLQGAGSDVLGRSTAARPASGLSPYCTSKKAEAVDNNKARQVIRPPRLAIRPPSPEARGGQGVRTSRRLRRFTTARPRLRLVRGVERPSRLSHVAGTLPRSHQLRII